MELGKDDAIPWFGTPRPTLEMPARSFVPIPDDFLKSIATESDRIPRLYYCGNLFSSAVFWRRLRWIHRLALRHARLDGCCLDFGAGGGVFLPTLARTFRSVVGVDLETLEAEQVVRHFRLDNVRLVRGDLTRLDLPGAPFDALVAADVLEHFEDLGPPISALRSWLAPDGRLFTSLPTENWVYVALRRLYGIEKPADHYHTGYEVEAFLLQSGFRRLERWFVPLRLPLAPLYLVSVWAHAEESGTKGSCPPAGAAGSPERRPGAGARDPGELRLNPTSETDPPT